MLKKIKLLNNKLKNKYYISTIKTLYKYFFYEILKKNNNINNIYFIYKKLISFLDKTKKKIIYSSNKINKKKSKITYILNKYNILK